MRKKYTFLIIVSLILIIIPACKKASSQADEDPPANTVFIYDFYFKPDTLNITKPGTTITWVNKSTSSHTVTSGVPGAVDGRSKILFEKWDSGTLAPGATFQHTFQWEGNWNYYCRIHVLMTATIIVNF